MCRDINLFQRLPCYIWESKTLGTHLHLGGGGGGGGGGKKFSLWGAYTNGYNIKVVAHARIIDCPRDQILINYVIVHVLVPNISSLVHQTALIFSLFGPVLGILCAVVLIDQ